MMECTLYLLKLVKMKLRKNGNFKHKMRYGSPDIYKGLLETKSREEEIVN